MKDDSLVAVDAIILSNKKLSVQFGDQRTTGMNNRKP